MGLCLMRIWLEGGICSAQLASFSFVAGPRRAHRREGVLYYLLSWNGICGKHDALTAGIMNPEAGTFFQAAGIVVGCPTECIFPLHVLHFSMPL